MNERCEMIRCVGARAGLRQPKTLPLLIATRTSGMQVTIAEFANRVQTFWEYGVPAIYQNRMK